ncbi:hypothetical protein E6O75_ATG03780 [Venturia nashicola]|uniref:Uncharacterized protein n=1 Tax=Venturia nashicola TaxID=86259 RepID=A0A4Z1P9H7_9PEZI|nr:hypothetical protein E6O75_ATG03780 [Venturia nashicola]
MINGHVLQLLTSLEVHPHPIVIEDAVPSITIVQETPSLALLYKSKRLEPDLSSPHFTHTISFLVLDRPCLGLSRRQAADTKRNGIYGRIDYAV